MIVVDTHVVFWMLVDPDRLSDRAGTAIANADSVGVAGISWYELAWLFDAGRLQANPDPRSWLKDAASEVTTLAASWEIGYRAASLSQKTSFPKDPADRLIYSTAIGYGADLVTKDTSLRAFDAATCIW